MCIKQIEDLNEWLYECLYEGLEVLPHKYGDYDRNLVLHHYRAAGLINTMENVDEFGDIVGTDWQMDCSVVDFVTWANYYKTYQFNRNRIGCKFVQSSSCVEGNDEDIAFVKVETFNGYVWICANCFGICTSYTNDDVNSLFMGSSPATKKKWIASQVIDPDYLEAAKKGIIE
jgi:hypothetical protein